MSQHDSESEPESDGSITPSNSDAEDYAREAYVEGRVCRFLGHIEAIPINREGTLVQVHRAWIRVTHRSSHNFSVLSDNPQGPRWDFCYKLPGPGNSWIARTSDDTDASTELFETVGKHSIKGYKLHTYECDHDGASSWIIESYLEKEKKERVPAGNQMVWTLQQRLGFEIGDKYGRHFRYKPSKLNDLGRERRWIEEGDFYGDEEDEEDDYEESDEEAEDEEESDEESEDEDEIEDEDEDEDEGSVRTFGAIWGRLT
ncbi:uncharacterized protein B0J16DRAFT_393919 [Fusarium flagelliforme]|uniref:Uncharacterized protein n=1 Tax=Fusarium flagelliforme TaxID=2675880 RepID=A0A395MC76_9HYPO|nr:uncharacterized protein B0J16DRAFT_393919 [Fusarium flagelliforme]KAH7191858.1 hypothetical protein B0J16DRAFT_393919 [Fusarium flagelliforme]RFN45517.1 hypothetical protein FIE12Z_10280 [Fusarium flagelliforme]